MANKLSVKQMREALDVARDMRRRGFRADDNIYATFDDVGVNQSATETFLANFISWLVDRHSSLVGKRGRGHFLQLIVHRKLHLYDTESVGENTRYKHLGSFTIFPDNDFYQGLVARKTGEEILVGNSVGAYGAFQFKGESRPSYRDLRTRTGPLAIFKSHGSDEETDIPEAVIPLLSTSADMEKYKNFLGRMGRKRGITYLFPPSDGTRVFLNYVGASGLLENYGSEDGARARTHFRNLAVIRATQGAFRGFQSAYIDLVNRTKSLRHLHSLGPPPEAYHFPMPTGANKKQAGELRSAARGSRVSNFEAWRAVSQRIDKHNDMRSPGSFFAKVGFTAGTKASGGPLEGTAKVTFNFEIDKYGVIAKHDRVIETKVGMGETSPAGLPTGMVLDLKHSVSTKTGEEGLSLEIGQKNGIAYEANSDGSFKFKGPSGVYAGWEPRSAIGGYGLCKKMNDFLPASAKAKIKQDAPAALQSLLGAEICAGLHFVLSREDALQAWLIGAPGFFEMRLPIDVLRSNWRSLSSFERAQLSTIGWMEETFDRRQPKDFPKSTKKPYIGLTPAQKSAAVRLGVGQELWLKTWSAQQMNAQNQAKKLVHGR